MNGLAAGIELYLGKEALTSSEGLRPVRWTGYIQAAQKYQGEVEGKANVLNAFLKKIESLKAPEEARAAFPELTKIWQSIFNIVENHAGEQYLYRLGQTLPNA